jgi:hypothetical protein
MYAADEARSVVSQRRSSAKGNIVPFEEHDLDAGRIGRHNSWLLEACCQTLPAVVYLFVLRPHNIPLGFTSSFILFDNVPCVRTFVHDVVALLFASHRDVTAERFRHGDDIGISLIPRDGIVVAFSALATFDGERPKKSADQGEQLCLGRINARAGAVTTIPKSIDRSR